MNILRICNCASHQGIYGAGLVEALRSVVTMCSASNCAAEYGARIYTDLCACAIDCGVVHETMQSQPDLLAATQPRPRVRGATSASQMDRSPRLRIRVPSLCKQIMIIQKWFLFACKFVF